jgi:hypothetical protein
VVNGVVPARNIEASTVITGGLWIVFEIWMDCEFGSMSKGGRHLHGKVFDVVSSLNPAPYYQHGAQQEFHRLNIRSASISA